MSDPAASNPNADDTDRSNEPPRRLERPWRPASSAPAMGSPDRTGPDPMGDSESKSVSLSPTNAEGVDPLRQDTQSDDEGPLPVVPEDRSADAVSLGEASPPEAPPTDLSTGSPTGEEGSPLPEHHEGEEVAEARTEEDAGGGPDADLSGACGQDVPSPPSSDNLDPTAPDDALRPDEPSASTSSDGSAVRDGKQFNDKAFSEDGGSDAWTDALSDADGAPSVPTTPGDERSFFTDAPRRNTAERIEEEIQDAAYRRNEGRAGSAWTPSEQADRRIASMFALLVSKVAEDMSYQQAPGDEFWDPRKIMRRQIDNRPLRHCKMDYTKRRLALLVDTSPSCRDEAVFYSKIASGAMLRDDIDIFLCPNGHIEARFDPEPMRFVGDERGAEWALDGRTVLYFTDWDGADELVVHSRVCNLYWFDNRPPNDYWHSDRERTQRIRLRYRGHHFHCPGSDAFQTLVRKIRP